MDRVYPDERAMKIMADSLIALVNIELDAAHVEPIPAEWIRVAKLPCTQQPYIAFQPEGHSEVRFLLYKEARGDVEITVARLNFYGEILCKEVENVAGAVAEFAHIVEMGYWKITADNLCSNS